MAAMLPYYKISQTQQVCHCCLITREKWSNIRPALSKQQKLQLQPNQTMFSTQNKHQRCLHHLNHLVLN